MSNSVQIGGTLRRLRTERNLTLLQLADKTSVTAAYISKLENEKVSPSIQTLQKIAEALEVSIIEFFDNDLVHDPCINPPDTWIKKRVKGLKADIRQMIKAAGNKRMQPFYTVIPPKSGPQIHPLHPGEEMIYVIEGRLTLDLNGDVTEMKPDSMAYISGLVPHRWANHHEEACQILWVCSPPHAGLSPACRRPGVDARPSRAVERGVNRLQPYL